MSVPRTWSTPEVSTFAHFGCTGTNQLRFAALANGAISGELASRFASVVVFGICFPTVAIVRIDCVLVKSAIQSRARSLLVLVTGMPRSEPPRKVGIALPLMWLGIGNAPIFDLSDGLPAFGSSA